MARRKLLVWLALLLIGLGAAFAAALLHPGFWLVPVAYVAGAGCAWRTFAVAVQLATAQQRAAIEKNRDEIVARISRIAEQQKGTDK